ncbi:MAG: hypothetical protein K0Q91_2280 [Fibrobacteria bacterium]|jgi:hypothetical protein|nr:hypothetical protein [Fibrobacteria bacterium]
MRFKLFAGALLAASLFIGCGGGKKDPTFEAAEYKKDKALVTARYVASPDVKQAEKTVKETKGKRVFVPLFQVEFINQSSASSSSYSISSGNSSKVSVTYKLSGVDTAAFTVIVDKLYADFVADLKAAGYDVVSKEELLSTPQYRELMRRGEKSNPVELASRLEGKNKALVVAPTGMGVVYFTTFAIPPSTVKTLWKALSGDTPEAMAAALADSLQATPVLAQYVVGFASLADTKVKGSGNSSVSAEYRFTIAGGHSKIAFVGEKGLLKSGKNKNRWGLNGVNGTAQLSKPIFGSNGWVVGRRDVTSTGTKLAEGVGNALSILAAAGGAGSTSSSKTKVYALDVDQAAYVERARDNLAYAQEMLLYGLTHDGLQKVKK